MDNLLFLDTETTGLNYYMHIPVEVAWAVGAGEVQTIILPHSLWHADPVALKINRYYERGLDNRDKWASTDEIHDMIREFKDKTLVGANPRFDARMLEYLYYTAGPDYNEPWHYRLFDISSYAAGVVGRAAPMGMREIFEWLELNGFPGPEPDHSAAGDVKALRHAYLALSDIANHKEA